MMPKYFSSLCFGLLLAANLVHGSTLSWDRTEVDLEMEPDQKEIRASYKVTNRGEERIRFSRVKTSCGCTASVLNRKILEPGDTTEIVATFNKGKRQGLNRLHLDVFIDSQAEAVATLRMNVQIPKLIEAMPQLVYWTPSSSKTARQVTLTLDQRYLDTIDQIDYDANKLDVAEEADPTGKASRILRITPKSFDTLYRGTITVKASGPDGRKEEARVMTFVQP
ncbi:MAG: DUF1573 domain-containing protein [Opitutales bacterium]